MIIDQAVYKLTFKIDDKYYDFILTSQKINNFNCIVFFNCINDSRVYIEGFESKTQDHDQAIDESLDAMEKYYRLESMGFSIEYRAKIIGNNLLLKW